MYKRKKKTLYASYSRLDRFICCVECSGVSIRIVLMSENRSLLARRTHRIAYNLSKRVMFSCRALGFRLSLWDFVSEIFERDAFQTKAHVVRACGLVERTEACDQKDSRFSYFRHTLLSRFGLFYFKQESIVRLPVVDCQASIKNNKNKNQTNNHVRVTC